jgi:hypothetical protein
MEEMKIIWGIFATISGGAVLGFWGWIAVKVVEQGRLLVELESRLSSQEDRCTRREALLIRMDNKLDTVCENVAGLTAVITQFGVNRNGGSKKEGEGR